MPGLLDPITIKTLTLRNRIVMPPMASQSMTAEGFVTDATLDYYVPAAEAGTGTIIVEHAAVVPEGRLHVKQLGIWDDQFLPGLARLASAIREAGAVPVLQITHAGITTTSAITGAQPVGPSARKASEGCEDPRGLSVDEIQALQAAFAAAAGRAKSAGFAAVELHGAHGYLLNQFLSPVTNARDDEYGGSFENRLRFALETIAQVRASVGPEFPIFYRLSADEFCPGGLALSDSQRIAPELVKAGVDVMDVSATVHPSWSAERVPEQEREGHRVPLAEGIKQVVSVPVIAVGKIRHPRYADQIVREGKTDFVAVGRAMLVDKGWSRKAIAALSEK